MPEFAITDDSIARIKDKVVVVTGTSSGIGLATAELLLSLHAKVIGGDLQPPPEDAKLATHSAFTHVRCDVTVWADQLALFNMALEKHGHVDHVFANAGIASIEGDEYLTDVFNSEGSLQEPRHPMLAVNLLGAANTVKLGVHYIKKNPLGGSIVANASAAGYQVIPIVDYCVSKSGLLALMRALTLTLPNVAPTVRINALAPWYTDTPILGRRSHDAPPLHPQPPAAVAKAAVSCMVEPERRGEAVFVMDERFHLVDNAVQKAVLSVLPEPQSSVGGFMTTSRKEVLAKED